MIAKRKIITAFLATLLVFAPVATYAENADYGTVAQEQTELAPDLEVVGSSVLNFGVVEEAGRSYTRTLVLRNNTDVEMGVDLAVESYGNDALSNDWKVADSWIVFVGGKTHYTIPANELVDISVRAAIPEDVKGGTYYATVKATAGEKTVSQDVIIDLKTEGYKQSGELIKNSVQFISHGHLSEEAVVSVKNTGTARFCVRTAFRYSNLLGLEEWKDVAGSSECIAQGETVELKVANGGDVRYEGYGLKKAEQKVYYYDADGAEVESLLQQNLLCVPAGTGWIILAAIVFIIVIVVIITMIRKHAKSKKASEKAPSEDEL